ncbi:MAG TPA: MFS transporter [Candidatus Dormibacteraeota bacterium]|jgi:MHS family proline/betaine transporter-like MFS transporter|nr:MFS transporter [Candidatus Dormibacteraeota bacterium]
MTKNVASRPGEVLPANSVAVPQSPLRTALAGLIGNMLEWFDFAVYGYFASDIGSQFFPKSSPSAQQLLAFAVFAIGFFARPVGSLVLGLIGDRIGRRALLTLSIALMGGSTLILGLLPTYQQIGLAAPLLLITMRLIQGFSVGGEYTGSMVYTTESASPLARGLISSSTAAGVTLGFILGSGSAWLVNVSLGKEEVAVWGWRIPFIASVLLCVAGWFLRRGLHETAEGLKAVAIRPPLLPSLIADWLPMVRTFGIVAMTNAAYYLTFTYVVERRKTLHGGGGSGFLLANTVSLVLVLIAKPLGGWLSDRVGRRRLMLILTVATMSLIYPALWLMLYGMPWEFLFGQFLLAVPLGMALGLQGAMVVEIFPLRTRVTSMSFAYSITLALAGGTAPLVSAWLIQRFGAPLAPAYYVMLYGAIGFALLWPMQETNTRTLSD